MNASFDNSIADGCIHGQHLFCSAVCPFHLQVRELVKKIQRHNFDGALRIYRNAVIFPRIVSELCTAPCGTACRLASAPIDLPFLERGIIRNTSSMQPRRYSIPRKEQRIAIVGGGLDGLACGHRLAEKNYQVSIYEKLPYLGGGVRRLLPAQLIDEELENEFHLLPVDFYLNNEVKDLSVLSADVIYISCGGSFESTTKPGVFQTIAGTSDALSPELLITAGISSATIIETYLKTKSRHEIGIGGIHSIPHYNYVTGSSQFLKVWKNPADKESVLTEAARCLKCDCNACMQTCQFLRWYERYPKSVINALDYGLSDTVVEPETNNRMANSCSNCGNCGVVCPSNIDLGDAILAARQQMYARGQIPPAYHDYWLRDMDFSFSSQANLTIQAPSAVNQNDNVFAFFPGGQLTASHPELVERAYEALLRHEPRTALINVCCGAPALWSGDEALYKKTLARLFDSWKSLGSPVLVAACPTCMKLLKRYLPEVKMASIYELMADWSEHLSHHWNDGVYNLYDPCSARYLPGLKTKIRAILKRASVSFIELSGNREVSPCCGFGGNIAVANPELAHCMAASIAGVNELEYITYCANCRDILTQQGHVAHHILELLLPDSPMMRLYPTISERRENRISLKKRLLSTFWGEDWQRKDMPLLLQIDDSLRLRMSEQWVLEQDVAEVILRAEADNTIIYDNESDCQIAHLEISAYTYWVKYRPVDEGYLLIDVYKHRMKIRNQ